MAILRVMLALIVGSSLISMACATHGTATFYTEYVPSACLGSKGPGSVMIAAANHALFGNGKACGTRFKVRCTGSKACRHGEVTVKIVDLCAGCGHNQLDLSQEAFAKIADPDAGKIPITFTRV